MLVDVMLGADHEAVAVLEAPDATRDAGVHVLHAFGLYPGAVVERDLPVGVAAVDDDVARVAQTDQLVDRLSRVLAGRDHDPHDPRPLLEAGDKCFPRVGARRALVRVPLDGLGGQVERNHPMTALQQTQGHVAAHATEAHESDLHPYFTACRTAVVSARQPPAPSRPSVTLTTGNRREVSDWRSPIACACFSTEKLYD